MKKTHRLYRLIGRLLPFMLALALCLAQTASAAGIRISGPLIYGPVKSYQVASTGAFAVYHTMEPNYTPHLFSVSLNEAAPVSLTSPLPMEDQYYSMQYKITPNGSRVLYSAFQESATVTSLFSIPIGGGTPVRLSGTGISAYNIVISSDNQWVVFLGFDSGGKSRLYRAAVLGATGSAVAITPAAASSMYYDLAISPDNAHVVFLGTLAPLDGWGIYSIPIGGGGYTRLTYPMTTNWIVDYHITPDSQRVILRFMDQASEPDVMRLYSVPMDGPYTSYYNLSGTLVSGGGVMPYFQISPDGKYVVFAAIKERANTIELYSYFLAAQLPSITVPVKLSVPIADNKYVSYANFKISPDSTRVIYFADMYNPHDLFSVPIGGPLTSNVQLNHPVSPSFALSWDDSALFTPDSSRVVYTSMQDTQNVIDLYSVPAAGPDSAAVKINPAQWLDPNGFAIVQSPAVSADGRSVFYTMTATANRRDLFKSPVNGPASQSENLSQISYDGGSISSFVEAPSGVRVIYRASQTSASQELFMVKIPAIRYLPVVRK